MYSKLSKKSALKRILIVSMTNIGDVVLTCPVIDIMCENFPQARIDVAVGPKAISLFEDNPYFTAKVFDKRAPLGRQAAWFASLLKERYDCVVDLRRTALAVFLGARYSTPVLTAPPRQGHKKEFHLNRLRQVFEFEGLAKKQYAVATTQEDEGFFEEAVVPALQEKNFVVIAPGAASSEKRWSPQGFARVADELSCAYKVIFVGDGKDVETVEEIQSRMKSQACSLAGKINLRQLAFMLKKSSFALTHDSGVMHLASYLQVPVAVLWGPTNIHHYGPWGAKSVVVRRHENCARCASPKIQQAHTCMAAIQAQDVMEAIHEL